MYLGAPSYLGYSESDIKAGKVAMVASHVNDLRAAASYGVSYDSSLYRVSPPLTDWGLCVTAENDLHSPEDWR